eukprot:scaffold124131_cov39-Tisochrysis_lutea.AAC.1
MRRTVFHAPQRRSLEWLSAGAELRCTILLSTRQVACWPTSQASIPQVTPRRRRTRARSRATGLIQKQPAGHGTKAVVIRSEAQCRSPQRGPAPLWMRSTRALWRSARHSHPLGPEGADCWADACAWTGPQHQRPERGHRSHAHTTLRADWEACAQRRARTRASFAQDSRTLCLHLAGRGVRILLSV